MRDRRTADRDGTGRGRVAIVGLFPPPGEASLREGSIATCIHDLVCTVPEKWRSRLIVLGNALPGHRGAAVEEGIAVDRCWERGSLRYPEQILAAVRRHRPAAVHVYYEIFLFGGAGAALRFPGLLHRLREGGWRTLVTISNLVPWARLTVDYMRLTHTPPLPWLAKPVLRLHYHRLLAAAERITTFESNAADTLHGDYGLPRERVEVIPLGVSRRDRASRQWPARARLGLLANQIVLLFFGYLTRYKGVDLLLEGFARHARSCRDTVLLVGGGKPTRLEGSHSYEGFWRDLQERGARVEAGRAQMLGYVPGERVDDLFAATDLLCLPYRAHRSSSGPLIQGLSWGLPMLLTDAFEDIVPASWSFCEARPEAVARFLDRFMTQPGFRKELEARFTRWAASRPTVSDVTERYLSIYDELAGPAEG